MLSNLQFDIKYLLDQFEDSDKYYEPN